MNKARTARPPPLKNVSCSNKHGGKNNGSLRHREGSRVGTPVSQADEGHPHSWYQAQ